MDRRNFLKTLAVSGAALTIGGLKGGAELLASSNRPVDLAAIMNGEPDVMFRRAMTEMGGIDRFVKRGNTVVVKPKVAWDKGPELAANTNPILVGEIVRQCVSAGAREIIVFDHTCDNWRRSYATSGIEAAAKSAGAKVIPADKESYYRTVKLPRGKVLKSMKVHEALLDSNVWINVPILKHHGGTNMTIAMKNLMGIIWDRRIFHRSNLQQCIADMCTLEKKPILNVVDAYRVLKANGPQGRSINDVVLSKALFVAQDMVAVDTASARFFNSQIRSDIKLEDVKHIAMGQTLKVGTMDIDKLNVKRVRL
jgi:uncharacterized protein (DUF362 family)